MTDAPPERIAVTFDEYDVDHVYFEGKYGAWDVDPYEYVRADILAARDATIATLTVQLAEARAEHEDTHTLWNKAIEMLRARDAQLAEARDHASRADEALAQMRAPETAAEKSARKSAEWRKGCDEWAATIGQHIREREATSAAQAASWTGADGGIDA